MHTSRELHCLFRHSHQRQDRAKSASLFLVALNMTLMASVLREPSARYNHAIARSTAPERPDSLPYDDYLRVNNYVT